MSDEALTLLETSGARGAFPDNTDCSLIPPRPPTMEDATTGVRPKLFLIWAQDLTAVDEVVEGLERTFVNCSDDVRGGYLRNDNVVIEF